MGVVKSRGGRQYRKDFIVPGVRRGASMSEMAVMHRYLHSIS